MKLLLSLLVFTLSYVDLRAQAGTPTTAIDGKYYLLMAERSPKGGTTQEMLVQYVERNGQKMLAAAACEQGCTPMVFSYQEENSVKLEKPVFFNSFGYYMMTYDDDSFVLVIPDGLLGKAEWTTIKYSNFYSKDAEKAKNITAEKISEYAISQSVKILSTQ